MRLITLFVLLFFSNHTLAQTRDTKATLALDGLTIDTSGKMYAFEQGNLYESDSFGADWHTNARFSTIGDIAALKKEDVNILLMKIMIPYLTKTGSTFCNTKGQQWTIKNGGISFSADYGNHWRQVAASSVRPEVLGTPRMYFQDTLKGLISGGEWGLFLTKDNCKTIVSLQTPSDQDKTMGKDKISDVLLFDDYLIVKSDLVWFYTKTDSINWKILMPIKELHLDSKTNQLWGFNQNNQAVQLDNQLKIIWKSTQAFPKGPLSMQVAHGYFYFICGQTLYKVNQKEEKHVVSYAKDKTIQVATENQDTADAVVWGWDDENLYQSHDSCKTWARVSVLTYPFSRNILNYNSDYENRRFNALNDSFISIYEFNKMNRIKINSQTHQSSPHQLTGLFDDFLKTKVTKIVVSKGTSGTYIARPSSLITYNLDNAKTSFKATYTAGYDYDVSKWREFRTKSKYNLHRFNYALIDSFIQKLNREPERRLTWSDFKMRESDKKAYLNHLKDITKQEPWNFAYNSYGEPLFYPNHIDTPFLRSIVLKKEFSDTLLADVFCHQEHFGSVINFLKMNIENEDGDIIEIERDYCFRTPRYLVWIIRYKNWEFRTANMDISKFLHSISPNSFWQRGNRPRWESYLEIAKFLYPRRPLHD
jgi:hypothetical protein